MRFKDIGRVGVLVEKYNEVTRVADCLNELGQEMVLTLIPMVIGTQEVLLHRRLVLTSLRDTQNDIRSQLYALEVYDIPDTLKVAPDIPSAEEPDREPMEAGLFIAEEVPGVPDDQLDWKPVNPPSTIHTGDTPFGMEPVPDNDDDIPF
jgi:hypothetical protein